MTSQGRRNRFPRVLAVEDGPFSKADTYCLLVGVVTTRSSIEGVSLDRICVDGTDGTEKVVSLAKHFRTLSLIMLPSVSLGGFNIVDPYELGRRLEVPIVIANPKKPNLKAVRAALQHHFHDWKDRVRVFDVMGSPNALRVGDEGTLYFYSVGMQARTARKALLSVILFGRKPEPLRIARILARALSHTLSVNATRRMCHKR